MVVLWGNGEFELLVLYNFVSYRFSDSVGYQKQISVIDNARILCIRIEIEYKLFKNEIYGWKILVPFNRKSSKCLVWMFEDFSFPSWWMPSEINNSDYL